MCYLGLEIMVKSIKYVMVLLAWPKQIFQFQRSFKTSIKSWIANLERTKEILT